MLFVHVCLTLIQCLYFYFFYFFLCTFVYSALSSWLFMGVALEEVLLSIIIMNRLLLCVCLFLPLSVCLSVSRSLFRSVCLSFALSMSVCLPDCLSVCLSLYNNNKFYL